MSSRECHERPKRYRLYLSLIIALSLCLNLLGIWWGQHHPDDVTSRALYMLAYRTSKPYNLLSPTLFTYIVLIFSVIPEKAFEIANLLSSGHDFQNALEISALSKHYPPTPVEYVAPRILTAIIGSCGIYLMYRVGKLCFGVRAGLLAALLLSVCRGYVTNSHYATLDVPVTVMMILAFWLCLRADRKQTVGSYALAGLTIGLATSTKYYGILSICPFILVHVNALRKKRIRWHRLSLSLMFILVGFVAGTPHSVLSFFRFARDIVLLFIVMPEATGPAHPLGLATHFTNLINLLGVPLFLMTLGSILYSLSFIIRSKKVELAYLWALILPFYLILGRSRFNPERYILPVVPFLLLITAHALDKLLSIGSKSIRRLGFAAIAFAVMYSFLYSLAGDLHFILDSKRKFLAWAEMNIPGGSRVELTSYCPKPEGDYSVHYRPHVGGRDRLYSVLEENRMYRFMLRQGIVWKHFLSRGKLPAEPIIDTALTYQLKREVPSISVRPDEKFDYSIQGLYERAPDYLVINHLYASRFTEDIRYPGSKETYPVFYHFYSTLLKDADAFYRRVATFSPPHFYLLEPFRQFPDNDVSVYKRIADQALPSNSSTE